MTRNIVAAITTVIFCTAWVNAQTLFTYGNKAVSQQEFIRAFEKNPADGDHKKALEDYLPLFINYKLKVQDALDKKLDTLSSQKSELDNYRSQLVENYINTRANTNALVKEAFARSQKDILLGHLFIGFTVADSLSVKNAHNQAALAKKELDGKQDFAAVVNKYSTDEANKASGGRAGWITVFSVPYPFETIIYELAPGGYSQVIRSNNGYHIFKKIAERPAVGTVKIAQILLVNADAGNKVNDAANQKLADSLYNLLQKGAKFEELANEFSNDRTSYSNGGVLPEFGVGTYSGAFEEAAFSLQKKGDITKPFATEYGIHILQLIEKKPVGNDDTNPEFSAAITEKVSATGRSQAARTAFLKTQMQDLKLKPAVINQAELFRFTDSLLAAASVAGNAVNAKTVVCTIGSKSITAADWVNYVKTARYIQPNESKPYPDLLQAFYLSKTEEYLFKNIELVDPTITKQLQEFRDANLLFEAMEKNVWNKAAADTTGLQQWYNKNKAKYHWGKSAVAVLITATDSALLPEVIADIKANPAGWHAIAAKYTIGIYADSNRYEYAQLPAAENEIKEGLVTSPAKNDLDGSYSFAVVLKLLPTGEQRSFDDARGFIINDYQLFLEEKWINQLKKKYPVKINLPVWNKLAALPAPNTSK
jgi:peptidyl-prolyl cis-trans isomerase SurA